MKILDLVEKIESLSMQEIDELLEQGIEIEDIQFILLNKNKQIEERLLKNEKIKQFLLKEVDSYILVLFEELKNNPNFEISDNLKKICETYIKDYFKETIEFDIENENGRKIVNIIMQLRRENSVISELCKDVKFWEQYCNGMRNIAKKDMLAIPKEHVLEYDKIFKEFFPRIILGYNIPEAETVLKMLERSDIKTTDIAALDEFSKQYQLQSNNSNNRIIRKDEAFSIILDYEILLRNKEIEKDGQYSMIREMEQSIREGKFGQNNSLSKEEFAFTVKMLQNPGIINSEMMQKLNEILKNPNLNLDIGGREDIELLLGETGLYNKIMETFPNLKNSMLKQMNLYVIQLFKNVKANPKQGLSENEKKICENYLQNYFEEGIELEITNESGRQLFRQMIEAKRNSAFLSEQYKTNKIWYKYRNAVYEMINKDLENLSQEEITEYDKTLKFHFSNVVLGYAIPEYEVALKIIQRDDVDVTKLESLDYLCKEYEKEKVNLDSRMVDKDRIFSIILDYDMLLKNKGIEKDGQYSPIREMEESIRGGKFGQNNNLSKEESAFVLKILQNPVILDNDVNDKLIEILSNSDIKLDISKTEINALLKDKEKFNQICKMCPNIQDEILKQINVDICSTFKDIYAKQRNIVLQERDKITQYLEDYFEMSLEKFGDTIEMSELFCLVNDLAHPNVVYNIKKLNGQEKTVQFLKEEYDKNMIFEKYSQHMTKLCNKLKMKQSITKEEFENYDNIFYEFSHRFKIDTKEDVSIFQTIDEISQKLQIPSKAIEDQIEIYIGRYLGGSDVPEYLEFYEMIENYCDRQLQGSALEINQNATISHLIRAAQKGKLPDSISSSILELLEERKKKSVDSQISNSKDNIENIAEMRLQQGRMPREYSELIIKQAILQKNDKIKYDGMIERALEDFSEYELEDAKINSYYISVVNQHLFNDKDTIGEQNGIEKTIQLSRQKLQTMGIFKLLETVLHENTHAEQDAQIENQQVSRDTYKMLKEKLLRREDNEFYDVNYLHMYCEIDARKNGYIKRLQTLRKIGLSDSQIMELQAENVKQTISEYLKYYEEGKIKKVGKEAKDVNTIFLELLQEKTELLEEYPVFYMEFEKNGESVQRKSFAKMLKTYEQLLSSKNDSNEIRRISGLYGDILLNGGPICEEKIEEELEELVQFNSDNLIINAYKNKILTTMLSKEKVMIATMKSMYNNHSEQERNEVQKKVKQIVQNKKEQDVIEQGKNNERSEI